MVLKRLTTKLAVGRGVLVLHDGTYLGRAAHPVRVSRGLTLSRRRCTHAHSWRRHTGRLRAIIGVGNTVRGSGSLLLRQGLRKLRRSLSLRCRRVCARPRSIVKHLGRGRQASVGWRRWTLRLVLELSRFLLRGSGLTRRHMLSKAISRIIRVQHLRLSTRVLRVLEIGKTVSTRPVSTCGKWWLLSPLSLARRRSSPLRGRRTSA